MKIGFRTPSLKKSFKARTTGKLKRQLKKSIIPGYGKKGMGLIKDPKKSIYNKVYHKTTVGVGDVLKDVNKSQKPKSKIKDNQKILFQRNLDIVNECAHLMESTKNPDVFFSRFKLYLETLEWLAKNENHFKLIGELPSEKLAKVKENSVKDINEFIDKYYQEIVSKINSLKTLNAKKNNCDKFRATLEQYDMYMNKENINHYNDLYSSLYESLN